VLGVLAYGVLRGRERTSKELSDAADLVTDLRIAVRKYDRAEFARIREGIASAVDELEKLEAQLR